MEPAATAAPAAAQKQAAAASSPEASSHSQPEESGRQFCHSLCLLGLRQGWGVWG